MKNKFSFSTGRLIALLCCGALPVLATLLGIADLLFRNRIVNFSFALTYIFIPLIALGLLAFVIFSNRKKWVKAVLYGIILVFFILAFYIALIGGISVTVRHYTGADVREHYTAVVDNYETMPDLSHIGNISSTEYHQVITSGLFAYCDTRYLICHYTPEEYESRKAALDNEFVFLTEPPSQHPEHCETAAEVKGYSFHMLSEEGYELALGYPWEITLIGYSDDACEIVYMACIETEIDVIDSLYDLIMNRCGFKYIQK